jgi:hypothetical protein
MASLHKPDAPRLTEVYVDLQITGFADGFTPGAPSRTVPVKLSNVRMSGRRHCKCQTAAVAVSRHRQLGYFSRGIDFGVSGRRQDGKNSDSGRGTGSIALLRSPGGVHIGVHRR